MIHPRCSTYVAAAFWTHGDAAAQSIKCKCHAHAGRLHPSHTFVPANPETYGHFGEVIMLSIRTLSNMSAALSIVTLGLFLASAPRELCVALLQSPSSVYHSSALLLATAAGCLVVPGANMPFLD
jgi:hypothetical protein